jgi:hypothetical protein
MKKSLALVLLLSLAGCKTPVPVERNFPDPATKELLEACPDLKLVAEGSPPLSDVLEVVTDNYIEYRQCKVKVDLWIKWYNEQKKIFEEVK